MIAAVERFGQEAEWGHVRDFSRALATAPGVRAILALLADDSNRPAYVHCTLGKDRTGMICGAVLAAIGVPREAVVEDYALSKRDLDAWFVQAIAASDRARKLFESATPTALRSFKSAAPENMEKMLQGLDEQYGSPADYIRSLAGGDAILAGLRRKLVEA
jgi:protein-tyrosine phosphatase